MPISLSTHNANFLGWQTRSNWAANFACWKFANDQLPDGGPFVTPELPNGVAGLSIGGVAC
jgi:hypothetical protein